MKKKEKCDFSTFSDILDAIKAAGGTAPEKGTELYSRVITYVKPYVESEVESELKSMAHLFETGLYNTFYDPWYTTGYYLNSCMRNLHYYKEVIEKNFQKCDYPECYGRIPEYQEYPDDLVIGLKGYYEEIKEYYEKYYKNPDLDFIKENLDAYIKEKYGKKRASDFISERDVYIPRVEGLGEIVDTVTKAGGIDAIEAGHDRDLKLEIRLACSPASMLYYETCMKIADEMRDLGFTKECAEPKKDGFLDKLKQAALPLGQLSLFDIFGCEVA